MNIARPSVVAVGLVGILVGIMVGAWTGGVADAADSQVSYEVGTPLPPSAVRTPAGGAAAKKPSDPGLAGAVGMVQPTSVTQVDPYPTAGGLDRIAVKKTFDIPSNGVPRDPVLDDAPSDAQESAWIPEQGGLSANEEPF